MQETEDNRKPGKFVIIRLEPGIDEQKNEKKNTNTNLAKPRI